MVQPINTSFSETLPLLAPPPNVVPNFVDPESRAYQMYIGMGVCIGIASIFMFLRLYVKVFISQTWNWDDCRLITHYLLITRTLLMDGSHLFDGLCMWSSGSE